MSDNLLASRIIIETLAQTRNGNTVNPVEIASKARTTVQTVEETLHKVIPHLKIPDGKIPQETRVRLALETGRSGLGGVAKTLTWQEFENFAAECLQLAGYETVKGLIAHGQGRKWQIDLIGMKGDMLLVFDCKHWHSSYSLSRLQNAAKHQKDALISLLNDVKCRKKFAHGRLLALPLILTLLDPQQNILEDAVVVPLEKLSDFLYGITPYSNDFPFIESKPIENSISAS